MCDQKKLIRSLLKESMEFEKQYNEAKEYILQKDRIQKNLRGAKRSLETKCEELEEKLEQEIDRKIIDNEPIYKNFGVQVALQSQKGSVKSYYRNKSMLGISGTPSRKISVAIAKRTEIERSKRMSKISSNTFGSVNKLKRRTETFIGTDQRSQIDEEHEDQEPEELEEEKRLEKSLPLNKPKRSSRFCVQKPFNRSSNKQLGISSSQSNGSLDSSENAIEIVKKDLMNEEIYNSMKQQERIKDDQYSDDNLTRDIKILSESYKSEEIELVKKYQHRFNTSGGVQLGAQVTCHQNKKPQILSNNNVKDPLIRYNTNTPMTNAQKRASVPFKEIQTYFKNNMKRHKTKKIQSMIHEDSEEFGESDYQEELQMKKGYVSWAGKDIVIKKPQ